jgi:EAL domain-containing protein (putative c-di-GMP-specific phosphodiesterase class I)
LTNTKEPGPHSGQPAQPTVGRVLVVDDQEDVLKAFARTLKRAGHEVDTATTGNEAVRRLQQSRYDAVVSDISMPDLDGIGLLRRARAEDLDLPVILATGAPALETAIEAVELGAMRYLTKPVEPATLSEAVARAVRWRRVCELRRKLAELAGESLEIGDVAGLQIHFDSALEKLFLHFQPIISWRKRCIVGYEALVRSAESKLPHPGALFDAAERLDRLQDLGRAIRSLCAVATRAAPTDALIFVNLHTRDLLDVALYERNTPLAEFSRRVILEITERAKLEQVNDIPGRVAKLRERGFRIAIDDIGAGYAGLNSFAQLEPEVVKLDMMLVRDVDKRPTKQKLIRSLTTLCNELGMKVVAEGIETPAERDTVVELGCDWLQGYLFAKPSPPFVQPKYDT